MKTVIGVIGDARADEDRKAAAERVGRLVAERKCVLLCGGMGGVMEAACRGARSAGGTTVGVLPGPDSSSANGFVDIAVVTGMGEARNVIVAKSSHCVIAVGGSFGTLSEISFALKSAIPVVGLDTWDVSDEIVRCGTPEEAVAKAVDLAAARRASVRP